MTAQRRVPVFATIIVVAAAAAMVALGLWQLDRMQQEDAKAVQYEAALGNREPVAFPYAADQVEARAYRQSQIDCAPIGDLRPTAGRSASDQTGYVFLAECDAGQGRRATVQLGWSRRLDPPAWPGGMVSGLVVPNREGDPLLLASPPVDGFEASQLPEPPDGSQNLSYAFQWFFFALIALVIYALALRRRWQDS